MTPRHFAWQAWHLVTSTFVSRGRRGAISHPSWFCLTGVALMVLGGALGPGLVARDAAALCVAGVALGDIHLRFTWQVWHHLTFTVVLLGRRGTHDTPRPPLPAAARMSHTTQLCHTPSFTHNFHTQLCQPASFTYLFTHNFHTQLCHTPSFTHPLSHTILSHTVFQLC